MIGYRICVCGGRTYGVYVDPVGDDHKASSDGQKRRMREKAQAQAAAEVSFLRTALDTFNTRTRKIEEVITGAADGADSLGIDWARDNEIDFIGIPAKWKKHGKAAGSIRNGDILQKYRPDFVIAFKGGRGTNDMIERAWAAAVPILAPSYLALALNKTIAFYTPRDFDFKSWQPLYAQPRS